MVEWEARTSPFSLIFSSSWGTLDMGANAGGEGGEGRLTLYGAYHFARRVLPLTEVSTHDIGHYYGGIACGALDGGDALPVLDQDER